MVALLAGVSVDSADESLLVPLHNAASFGHLDVVRLLLEKGANPNAQDRFVPSLFEQSFDD